MQFSCLYRVNDDGDWETIVSIENGNIDLRELSRKFRSEFRASVIVKGNNLIIGKYVLEHKVAKIIRSLTSKKKRRRKIENIV
ncbi:MAG: hypothetical protein J7J78_04250 [Thermoprotei archaeon]|nr:hypothetical protein [Thermoprotei archaeon]